MELREDEKRSARAEAKTHTVAPPVGPPIPRLDASTQRRELSLVVAPEEFASRPSALGLAVCTFAAQGSKEEVDRTAEKCSQKLLNTDAGYVSLSTCCECFFYRGQEQCEQLRNVDCDFSGSQD